MMLADATGTPCGLIIGQQITCIQKRTIDMRIAPLVVSAAVLALLPVSQAAPIVETLPSGVKVQHVKLGEGAAPSSTSTVTVHYRGTLDNGTEFDSSYKRNQPATFGLNQVIPCWTQGVQKMKAGGTAKLTCPPETGYGSRALPRIPPNSVLKTSKSSCLKSNEPIRTR